MNSEEEAKKVLIQQKHGMHEEMLSRVIKDLEYNLEHHARYTGEESLFAHVRANAAALLFLCQERKRDRAKRGENFTKPVQPIPPAGSDLK